MSPIALLSIVLTVQSVPTVSTDSRLSPPVTLSHKYLPVKQFATLIKDKTGVEILVQAKLQERKMAVFCIDRPLNEVMDRAADAMLLKWEPVGERYRLVEPAEIAAADERIRQAESKAQQQGLREYCAELARISRLSPSALEAELAQRDAAAKTKRPDLASNRRVLDLIKKTITKDNRSASVEKVAGAVLAQLGQQQVERFFTGQTVFALSPPVPGLPALAPDLVTQSYDPKDPPRTKGVLMLRFKNDRIEFKRQTLEKSGGESSGSSIGQDWARAPRVGTKNERDAAWESTQSPEILQTELTEPGPLPSDPPKNRTLTMADQLQELHRRTKLPVVAEAFRIPETHWRWTNGATVAEWLKSRELEPVAFGTRGYHVRVSDGWLMGRKRTRWIYLPIEPAEDLVLAANAEVKPSGMLSTDSYARFAAGLTDEQATSFTDSRDYNVNFLMAPLRTGIVGFRLIGTLSEAERKRLYAGQILPQRSLNARAQARYREALTESAWQGIVREEVLYALLPTAPPFPSNMSLWLRSAADSRWSTAYMPETLQSPNNFQSFSSTPIDLQRLDLGTSKELAASVGIYSDDTRKKQ
jgi:hypothetical protein